MLPNLIQCSVSLAKESQNGSLHCSKEERLLVPACNSRGKKLHTRWARVTQTCQACERCETKNKFIILKKLNYLFCQVRKAVLL